MSTDPRQESIIRQHSQEMALRYAALHASKDDTVVSRGKIKEWTDWFAEDATPPFDEAPDTPEKPQEGAEEDVNPDLEVSPQMLNTAYEAFLDAAGPEASLGRSEAKKLVDLKKSSLGVASSADLDPGQRIQFYEFLEKLKGEL